MKLLTDSYAWLKNPYELLDSMAVQYGLSFDKHLLAPGRCFITGDHRLIDEIRSEPALEAGKTIQGLRTIMGSDSLIMLHGEAHRKRRDTIVPFFRGDWLSSLDERITRISREELGSMQGVFSAYDVFQRISLRAILLHLFGSLSAEEESRAMKIVLAFLGTFKNPLFLFLRPLQFDLGRFSPWGRALQNRSELMSYIETSLIQRPESTAKKIADAMESEGASKTAVLNEILALILFGHDTGAAVLSWAAAHICARPDVQERIRTAEGSPGSLLLRGENYVHACILETMRLTPAVVHLTRRSEGPVQIGNWRIEPGTAVLPCIYLAQRDPAVFENPGEFSPERFLGNGFSQSSFFPFGFGSRLCVGMPFVLRQMQLTLRILPEFSFRLAAGYRPGPERKLVIILPARGCLLEARR